MGVRYPSPQQAIVILWASHAMQNKRSRDVWLLTSQRLFKTCVPIVENRIHYLKFYVSLWINCYWYFSVGPKCFQCNAPVGLLRCSCVTGRLSSVMGGNFFGLSFVTRVRDILQVINMTSEQGSINRPKPYMRMHTSIGKHTCVCMYLYLRNVCINLCICVCTCMYASIMYIRTCALT